MKRMPIVIAAFAAIPTIAHAEDPIIGNWKTELGRLSVNRRLGLASEAIWNHHDREIVKMGSILIGGAVFACLVGATLIGMALRARFPEHRLAPLPKT